MKNPPFGVKLVMAAVCVMKGISAEKIVDPMGTGQRVRYTVVLHCVQKKTPTDSFFHISMNNVSI